MLLVPLVTWVAPANLSEGGLLRPSVQHCWRRWQWRPDVIVGDLGYIAAASKQLIREGWQAAVVTRLKENLLLVPPLAPATTAACPQGQSLPWLGYAATEQAPWFGVPPGASLCPCCWQAGTCPREFAYPPSDHEPRLGLWPMNTTVNQRLLQQVRPWLEAAQSYEKNPLGLSPVFLNSLRLTWTMALLADAAVRLRAGALRRHPQASRPLDELTPWQLDLALEP